MQTSDLIIIGSGPGGYRAAAYAASKGLSVSIIEEGAVGGTCLNAGCIPTKALARNAEVIDTLRKAETFGLQHLNYDLDFCQVMARKQQVVETLRKGVETLLSAPGISLVRGKARFTATKVVTVGDEEYTATSIIIATGSTAKRLPIPGNDHPKVVTSTELLNIDYIPQRLVIIGAGVVGMEFASIFNSFGSEVTVLEYLKECLPMLDSDIAKRLRQTLSKRGINFVMQANVKEVNDEGVTYERKGKSAIVEGDVVLMATGRAPRTEGLQLENTQVEIARNGILVDEHYETTCAGVYAIGDVNGRIMLAHAATAQGLHVVNRILGCEDNMELDIIPSAIFTNPEAAGVGVTEEECKQNGIPCFCRKGFHRANGKALAMDEAEGMVKLVFAQENGLLIGCHAFGAHSADMVQEASALMTRNVTLNDLRDIVHIHPTIGEIIQDACW
jgi:dihydrolipoamide dehydrogenase